MLFLCFVEFMDLEEDGRKDKLMCNAFFISLYELMCAVIRLMLFLVF